MLAAYQPSGFFSKNQMQFLFLLETGLHMTNDVKRCKLPEEYLD